MSTSTFRTNPILLEELLRDCDRGAIQLPDFQRSWVWDDERIRSLLASISQAFPVGALMTLETGGHVDFKPRPVQGAPEGAWSRKPDYLLLDGQQRMTSLYQTTLRGKVVETVTPRNAKVRRWYYFDMTRALDAAALREEAVVGVPEERVIRSNFGKDIDLDLSSPEKEYEAHMFPLRAIFDAREWSYGYDRFWSNRSQPERRFFFRDFETAVIENFRRYQVPVIALDRATSKEAVCLVFEKVNTGGKPLDAFELVTAMYAADGFELRKDWLGKGAQEGRQKRLAAYPVLKNVAATDFLQAVSLLHTRSVRSAAAKEGRSGRELPPVSATRQSLLDLPKGLPKDAYVAAANRVEAGFVSAAKLLHSLRIYRVFDLPYQSQLVPLAAILAELGSRWEHEAVKRKLVQWYWNGVFGELYGSATESRFARDAVDMPAWIDGGELPGTIRDATFRADRLLTMRMRLSAAYKGVNALLMEHGAKDFRTGQGFDQTVFFDEKVDIHHVFPRDYCKKKGIPASRYDSIVNKTPLSDRTNRMLGGTAPSAYLARLEKGGTGQPPISAEHLDGYIRSHLAEPALLRADDFDAFMSARQEALLGLIEKAMGQTAYRGDLTNEPEEEVELEPDAEPNMIAAE